MLARLESVNKTGSVRFRKRERAHYPIIDGPFGLSAILVPEHAYDNNVERATFRAVFHQSKMPFPETGGDEVERHFWSITCLAEDRIGYLYGGEAETTDEGDVASKIVALFCALVARKFKEMQVANQHV